MWSHSIFAFSFPQYRPIQSCANLMICVCSRLHLIRKAEVAIAAENPIAPKNSETGTVSTTRQQ